METGISKLEAAVVKGCAIAAGSGRPEAVLRAAVQPVLAELLSARGLRSKATNELTLAVPTSEEAELLDAPLASQGRPDAIYNRFVIEFEPPGSLRPSLMHSATRHAITQVKQYLRGVCDRTGLPLDRVAGCAFDGKWIVYVTWERGDWHEVRPQVVDRTALQSLVDTLASLATGRGLTADNLDQDFGRASPCAQQLVPILFTASRSGNQRTEAMFRQWEHDIGVASGPFSTTDLDDWAEICKQLGLPPSPSDALRALFALQTYFSLVAKLVALIILEGATGNALVGKLSASADIFVGFDGLESGALTRVTGAMNVIEPSVLSWYVHERRGDLGAGLRVAAELANEYSAEIVEVTPLAVRDVLKDLYQRLLPRSIRHRLGEYYTPDWMAEHLVDLVLSTPTPLALTSETRVVDPACGSGTFLVEVVNRQVSAAPADDRERTLDLILQNVVGFDISPLAVQAAKVNYLLALAPLLKTSRRSILIPIFMADAVSPPRRGDLFEGDVFVFNSSEGPWQLPTAIVEHGELVTVGAAITRALAENETRDRLEVALRGALKPPCNDPATISRLGDLFTKLLKLHKADRNGMWWQILGNAFAPMLQGSFDIVVGNPPWVSWETLPEAYRRANDSQWLTYGLRPDVPPDRRQASQQVRLDLAMLFVNRSVDKLLRQGGRLAFVITATVFKSELAGRGFRRFRLPGGRFRACHIEDLSSLRVFTEAANQTALLVVSKEDADSFPVPLTEWRKAPGGPGVIAPGLALEVVRGQTSRLDLHAEPVNPADPGSPLISLPRPALELTRDIRKPSVYAELVREGVNTRGANGVFFLTLLGHRDRMIRVRNRPEAGRNQNIRQVDAWIEEGAVRTLLRGEDVHRPGAESSGVILFFHDADHVSHPLPDRLAASRFPAAYAFAKNFEAILRARRAFRNFDPSGEDWLGIYSVTQAALAGHKVVYREISQGMIAAAVHSPEIIPDHKLHIVPCGSAEEADWLAEVLNSDVIDRLARAFAISTSIGGSLLRYIGIKRLSGNEVPSAEPQRLERALGLKRPQLQLVRTALNVLKDQEGGGSAAGNGPSA